MIDCSPATSSWTDELLKTTTTSATGLGTLTFRIFEVLLALVCWPFKTAYLLFFVEPLKRLYFQGPFLGGYGFWAGKSTKEICLRGHDVAEDVWESRLDLCEAAVEAKFASFIVACETFAYLIAVVTVVWFTLSVVRERLAKRNSPDKDCISEPRLVRLFEKIERSVGHIESVQNDQDILDRRKKSSVPPTVSASQNDASLLHSFSEGSIPDPRHKS